MPPSNGGPPRRRRVADVSAGDARFSSDERDALLALKGVGPTVVQRLEQMGIASLRQLAASEPSEVVASAAGLTGSTCWKNSPQARAAIQSAVDFARSRT
jgi:predicted flap endonuclease-1-like 5' DNA nuclease